MSRKGRIPAKLRDDAVDYIQTEEGAQHSLLCDPAAPDVLFRSTTLRVAREVDGVGRIVHPAMTCPVDADAVEDLACCAECAVLQISLVG